VERPFDPMSNLKSSVVVASRITRDKQGIDGFDGRVAKA
jgi:hypothetical protein